VCDLEEENGFLFLQEVRLTVEDKEFEEIVEKSSLLCFCFVVLENTIVYVSKHSEQDSELQGTENSPHAVLQRSLLGSYKHLNHRDSTKAAHRSNGGTRLSGVSPDSC